MKKKRLIQILIGVILLATLAMGLTISINANAAEIDTSTENAISFTFFTSDVYAYSASQTSGYVLAYPIEFVVNSNGTGTMGVRYFSTTAINIMIGSTNALTQSSLTPVQVGFISSERSSTPNMAVMAYVSQMPTEEFWIEKVAQITSDRDGNGYNINFVDENDRLLYRIKIQISAIRIYDYWIWYDNEIVTIPTDISKAFDQGYKEGKKHGYEASEADLQNARDEGFYEGRQYQASIELGTFRELILAVIDAPIRYLDSLLGLEILGTNLAVFFKGLITAALGLWLLRQIL